MRLSKLMVSFFANVACFVSLFVGVGVSWPAIVLYGSKVVPLPRPPPATGHILGVICAVRNEMDSTPYPMAFFGYLWCGVSFCFLILSVLYSLIGKVMLKRRRAKKRRKKKMVEFEAEKAREDAENADVPLNSENGCHLNTGEAGLTLGVSGMITAEPSVTQESAAEPETHVCGSGRCAGDLGSHFSSWRGARLRPPKSTLMLFAISAVFVLSFVPFLIIMIIRQHVGPLFYPSLSPGAQVVVNVFSRSYLVNNVANPIVYGMCNKQFRDEVRKALRLPRRRLHASLSRDESKLAPSMSC
ncbi:uncharacterized protein LOC101857314 [Aplysia californica]|uniref:Uncharacterized protein LOC101857314 n=1 Tax=Aplysia californica TaxID=6500 RepID=A0ABM0JF47_APLCA|nr:uncharacterized protein LOC101857314 [Aplysia californica]